MVRPWAPSWIASRLSRYEEARSILEARGVWFAAYQNEGEDVEPVQPTFVELALAEKYPEGFWVNAGVEVNALYGLGNFEAVRR